MSIHLDDLRLHVVRPTLRWLDLWSEAAERLVLTTAAHESHLGEQGLAQRGGGPALGIYQMEPATHTDLLANGMTPAHMKLLQSRWHLSADLLPGDLYYSTAMCRLQYRRFADPLPEAHDLHGLACYWKRHWNTNLGAGSLHQFETDARRFGL